MDWSEIVATAAAVGVGTVVMALGSLAAMREPELGDGVVVLRYPRIWRAFLGFGALFFVGVSMAVGWEWMGDRSDLIGSTSAIVCSAVAAVAVLRLAGVRFELDERGIRGRGAFGRRREILWTDLVRVRHSSGWNAWVLHDRHGAILRVSRDLVGSDRLVTTIESKLPEPVWRDAVTSLRRFRQNHPDAHAGGKPDGRS